MTADTRAALFRAAHDIKGEAATFGYPIAGRIAGSLCRLIDEIDCRRGRAAPGRRPPCRRDPGDRPAGRQGRRRRHGARSRGTARRDRQRGHHAREVHGVLIRTSVAWSTANRARALHSRRFICTRRRTAIWFRGAAAQPCAMEDDWMRKALLLAVLAACAVSTSIGTPADAAKRKRPVAPLATPAKLRPPSRRRLPSPFRPAPPRRQPSRPRPTSASRRRPMPPRPTRRRPRGRPPRPLRCPSTPRALLGAQSALGLHLVEGLCRRLEGQERQGRDEPQRRRLAGEPGLHHGPARPRRQRTYAQGHAQDPVARHRGGGRPRGRLRGAPGRGRRTRQVRRQRSPDDGERRLLRQGRQALSTLRSSACGPRAPRCRWRTCRNRATLDRINGLVAKRTKGLIPTILDRRRPLPGSSPSTRSTSRIAGARPSTPRTRRPRSSSGSAAPRSTST